MHGSLLNDDNKKSLCMLFTSMNICMHFFLSYEDTGALYFCAQSIANLPIILSLFLNACMRAYIHFLLALKIVNHKMSLKVCNLVEC